MGIQLCRSVHRGWPRRHQSLSASDEEPASLQMNALVRVCLQAPRPTSDICNKQPPSYYTSSIIIIIIIIIMIIIIIIFTLPAQAGLWAA
jgi:hypothetical protein